MLWFARHRCPVCGGRCAGLDRVDFNKSCEEAKGHYLPRSGVEVHYVVCRRCAFCFAPDLYAWPVETFAEKIYNRDYKTIDPDYDEVRPRANAQALLSMIGSPDNSTRHLDYGGGNGLLSRLLRDAGWSSASYDLFVDGPHRLREFLRFELITAFEVFEHVPYPKTLMGELAGLLTADGVILFSTLISDYAIERGTPLSWWYAAPRNGHISLFSRESLVRLGRAAGFRLASCSQGLHLFFRASLPSWARSFIRI